MTDTSVPIVFYDDGCNFFRRENAHYQSIERSDRIRWFDIQQSENEPRENDLSWQTAMQRMHVLDSDDRMVSGTDVLLASYTALSIAGKCGIAAGCSLVFGTGLLSFCTPAL